MATHPVMILPPGPSVYTYLSSDPPPASIPSGFTDAMAVRKSVFIDEQHCRLENEIDDDDARSYHWVVYASISTKGASPDPDQQQVSEMQRRMSEGGKVPVGTVRLVPPPHSLHPADGSVDGVGGKSDVQRVLDGDQATRFHDGKEPYVKIGRMATVKEFRGLGLGKLMVGAALDWAATHKPDIEVLPDDPVEKERIVGRKKDRLEWKGLVMAHSQVTATRFYEGFGFEIDHELGTWIEEGIEHVAMWKRLEVKELVKTISG